MLLLDYRSGKNKAHSCQSGFLIFATILFRDTRDSNLRLHSPANPRNSWRRYYRQSVIFYFVNDVNCITSCLKIRELYLTFIFHISWLIKEGWFVFLCWKISFLTSVYIHFNLLTNFYMKGRVWNSNRSLHRERIFNKIWKISSMLCSLLCSFICQSMNATSYVNFKS